jgi:hypothetical protein
MSTNKSDTTPNNYVNYATYKPSYIEMIQQKNIIIDPDIEEEAPEVRAKLIY